MVVSLTGPSSGCQMHLRLISRSPQLSSLDQMGLLKLASTSLSNSGGWIINIGGQELLLPGSMKNGTARYEDAFKRHAACVYLDVLICRRYL